jgi:glutathione gamma-glutamylcysteinyltransferase
MIKALRGAFNAHSRAPELLSSKFLKLDNIRCAVSCKYFSTLTNTQESIKICTTSSSSIINEQREDNHSQTPSNEQNLMHTCHIVNPEHTPIANSFYRRPLPETLVPFSSTEGKKLFREALHLGYLEGYFALAEQFVSQSDPAYCGLATLSMCLNALNIDPNRLWKGPWRWFAEDMLDCCTPLEVVKKRGITFTEFACLARCNGATVLSFRGDESSLEHFRNSIKEATSQHGLILASSYSRQALGQTGQGHYSPIGGYHPGKDLALVLDVARFKYAPHWVPVEVLWKSVCELDQDTHRPRGYYLLSRSIDHRPPTVCRITSKSTWSSVARHMVLCLVQKGNPQTADELVEEIVQQLPPEASQVLRVYPEELQDRLSREHADAVNKFFGEISQTQMYKIARSVLGRMGDTPFHGQPYGGEILTVLLLACPSQLFGTLAPQVREHLAQVRSLDTLPTEVRSEIMQIREQMFQVIKSSCKKCESGNVKVSDCKYAEKESTPPQSASTIITNTTKTMDVPLNGESAKLAIWAHSGKQRDSVEEFAGLKQKLAQ